MGRKGGDAWVTTHGLRRMGYRGSWETSHHAQAMKYATESTVHGDFNDAHYVYGDVATTFYRKDSKFMVRTDGPDGALQDYEAKFTFGVSPLEQYLLELPGGRLQALTIAWDSRPKADGAQQWFHLHPNETIKAGDPLHWTGLQQNWNFECAECHSTNLRRNYDPVSGAYKTSYSEINVSCESCHGPGSLHASWARKDAGWQSLDATKGLAVSLDERRDVSWTLDPTTGNGARSAPRRTTYQSTTDLISAAQPPASTIAASNSLCQRGQSRLGLSGYGLRQGRHVFG